MPELLHLWRRRPTAECSISATLAVREIVTPLLLRSLYSTSTASGYEETEVKGKWLVLPAFVNPLDASSLGKKLAGRRTAAQSDPTTALKWVRHCCPNLPMSLVQKLFRLRQVRKDSTSRKNASDEDTLAATNRLRRVAAKDIMMPGEVVHLPLSVQNVAAEKCDSSEDKQEISFVRGLELYKDESILVVNKPPGVAVQGGVGIKQSMDIIAARCLRYDYPEPPRLVHRLDRDTSGVLLLGRTQTSASVLHAFFREKTFGALTDDIDRTRQLMQRKYLALVMGSPRHMKGLISAPLTKIVLEDGKSERITIANHVQSLSSHHALTEYKVIKSSTHGYTWLELWPLTGRKHQLRVHCAEVLGTPIVGDYKYGWHAHRKWEPMPLPEHLITHDGFHLGKLPYGIELGGGNLSDKLPRLHLHCKQMVLPNISTALEQFQSASADHDFSELKKLDLVAPLPLHMQISWDILNS